MHMQDKSPTLFSLAPWHIWKKTEYVSMSALCMLNRTKLGSSENLCVAYNVSLQASVLTCIYEILRHSWDWWEGASTALSSVSCKLTQSLHPYESQYLPKRNKFFTVKLLWRAKDKEQKKKRIPIWIMILYGTETGEHHQLNFISSRINWKLCFVKRKCWVETTC